MNKIVRPWGREIILSRGKNHWIKEIFVKNNHRSSLQSHKNRNETWVVLSGKGAAIVGKNHRQLRAGNVVKITRGRKHRWIGIRKLHILEIASGKLDEKDIVRYQDNYGRAG